MRILKSALMLLLITACGKDSIHQETPRVRAALSGMAEGNSAKAELTPFEAPVPTCPSGSYRMPLDDEGSDGTIFNSWSYIYGEKPRRNTLVATGTSTNPPDAENAKDLVEGGWIYIWYTDGAYNVAAAAMEQQCDEAAGSQAHTLKWGEVKTFSDINYISANYTREQTYACCVSY